MFNRSVDRACCGLMGHRFVIGSYLEVLEPRVLFSTYTVTTLNDNGPGSFRDAVANSTADTINFGVTGTILLSSPVQIDRNVSIAGPGTDSLTISGQKLTGILLVGSNDSVTVSRVTMTAGHGSNGESGGILSAGELTLDDCTLLSNSGGSGGAINCSGSTTIRHCTFSNNSALGTGAGAIWNQGTLAVTGSRFSENDGLAGGAIWNGPGSKATLTACTFSENTAITGGAIVNLGDYSLENCTITLNSASAPGAVPDGEGGGIANQYAGSLTVTNCTIAGNSAGRRGAGIWAESGNVSLYNTIVASNTRIGTPNDIVGTLDANLPVGQQPSSYNLIGTGGSGGLTNGSNGNIVGVANPGLGPLANYGGPTQTIALLAGSPALDHGSNMLASATGLTTDQRGLARVFNETVDIGAYEAQPPALAGDVNHDGKVDFSDLLLLAQNYDTMQPLFENGDLNGHGTVGFSDLLILAQNYGQADAAPASVATKLSRRRLQLTTDH